MTDASGNVDVTYTYDAFGAIRTQSSANDNYWGFTGEQRDEETGLTYLRARYYDPETGRFLSTDPLGGGYPYAANSPLNATDRTGLCPLSAASSWGSSDGSSACYDASGQLLSCSGTCPTDSNSPLHRPVTITGEEFEAQRAAEAERLAIKAELAARRAPVDDASQATAVVVSENGPSGSGKPKAGDTRVGKITPPSTGNGGVVEACDVDHQFVHYSYDTQYGEVVRQHSVVTCNVPASITIVSVMFGNGIPVDLDGAQQIGQSARTTVQTPCPMTNASLYVSSIYVTIFPSGYADSVALRGTTGRATC